MFDNYKYPIRKVKTGFGFIGVVIRSKREELVQSHIDGLFYQKINNAHVKKGGFDNVSGYKKYYGIGAMTSLMSKSLRAKQSAAAKKRYLSIPPEKLLTMKLKGFRVMKERRINENRKGSKIAFEHRNRKGTCPDQLLKKIKQLEKKIGRVPSTDDFRMEYGTKFLGVICYHFGTWKNAVKLAGFVPLSDQKPNGTGYLKEELLERLKMFYEINGYSPTTRDFSRTFLPCRKVFSRYWKTLNAARIQAGIPSVSHIKKGDRFALDTLLDTFDFSKRNT